MLALPSKAVASWKTHSWGGDPTQRNAKQRKTTKQREANNATQHKATQYGTTKYKTKDVQCKAQHKIRAQSSKKWTRLKISLAIACLEQHVGG
jgi:hypothetical protein